jgi:hypothetical protein
MALKNMPENTRKSRKNALKSPKNARKIIHRALQKIFEEGAEVENAGKIASLLNTWLKAWELENLADLNRRLEKLEALYGNEKRDRTKD